MEKIYVPLGWRCDATGIAMQKGVRKFAYPFDWNIKSYDAMYHWLVEGTDGLFKNYKIGKGKYSSFYEDKGQTRGELQLVFDFDYQTLFVHDYYPGQTLDVIKEKYTRRYDRLVNHIKEAKEIVLVLDELPSNVYSRFKKKYKGEIGIDLDEVWSRCYSLEDIKNVILDINNDIEISTIQYNKL